MDSIRIWKDLHDSVKKSDNVSDLVIKGESYNYRQLKAMIAADCRSVLRMRFFLSLDIIVVRELETIIKEVSI